MSDGDDADPQENGCVDLMSFGYLNCGKMGVDVWGLLACEGSGWEFWEAFRVCDWRKAFDLFDSTRHRSTVWTLGGDRMLAIYYWNDDNYYGVGDGYILVSVECLPTGYTIRSRQGTPANTWKESIYKLKLGEEHKWPFPTHHQYSIAPREPLHVGCARRQYDTRLVTHPMGSTELSSTAFYHISQQMTEWHKWYLTALAANSQPTFIMKHFGARASDALCSLRDYAL